MRTSAALLLFACLFAPACKRDAQKTGETPGPAAPPTPTVAPTPDRVGPGLLESETLVFGVRLPRGLELSQSYGTKAIATGQVNPDDVAEYLRHRVDARHVELGQNSIVFPNCKFLETKHSVRLEVLGQGIRTRLIIQDLERPVATETKSEAERWREVGMSPDGRKPSEQLE